MSDLSTTRAGEALFAAWSSNLDAHAAMIRADKAGARQAVEATEKALSVALNHLQQVRHEIERMP